MGADARRIEARVPVMRDAVRREGSRLAMVEMRDDRAIVEGTACDDDDGLLVLNNIG